MSIAESRSVRALGIACCSAITELTGSPTVGLYLLDGLEPELVYSRHVAEGLLDNYRAGFWKRDPVLDCIMTQGRAVDGETVIGPQQWRHSPSFEMLHEWGFAYNMGGPLWCGQKIVGVLFTATTDTDAPYTMRSRQRMEMLCRAGSLALTNMTNAGAIDAHPAAIRVPEPATTPVATLSASLPPRSATAREISDRPRDGDFRSDREGARREPVPTLRRAPPAGSDMIDDQLERADEGRPLPIVPVTRIPSAGREIVAEPSIIARRASPETPSRQSRCRYPTARSRAGWRRRRGNRRCA
ncbi:hypothetical protein [Bradyrhizobium sp. 2]|uniref:hypothetical protein n=1 Tax=Bradyrhizobium sp. 2 TaxID=190045 RepID=UPI001FFBD7D1|nr:hypothetical protein [Bradyrhizobium sp. 2]